MARFQTPQLASDAPFEYSQFWRLWREEKFFECHETLEELWRRTSGPQKWFYAGLINAAVAIYQHRRGNFWGAARQYSRARVKLHPFAPFHDGVNIEELLSGVREEIEPSLQKLSKRQAEMLAAVEHNVCERMKCDF
jgi:predicted metal-dependent hydrolase